MDKPLYILIFLLLWSNRIRGGEKEDINGSFSPSTQKTGVKNSLIDKASTSTVTKKTTIFDPDSESSEKVSPPIKSKTLETNTGTVEPSVPNSNTPIHAKESTRKNTTTLSDTDSDSSETNSSPIKSEETENKPGVPEIFLPISVTIKPARDSTTVNTTESNHDSEPSDTDSASIKSEISETKLASTTAKSKTTPIRDLDSESSETESAFVKSEALDSEIGTQQPSFHNFESHEPANESSETELPSIKSEIQGTKLVSTIAKSKTSPMRDADSESSETDSPPITSKTTETKSASTSEKTETISISGPEPEVLNDMPGYKSTAVRMRTPRATHVTSMEPLKQPTIVTNDSTSTAPRDPNCTYLKNTQFVNQTATSLILDINHLPETAYEHLCVKELYKPGNKNCSAMKYPTMIFEHLNASTEYHISVFSYDSNNEMNKLLSINSCPISGYTAPRDPNCTDLKNTQFVNQTATSLILDINHLPEIAYKHLCVKELYKPGNTNCTAMKYPTMIFANLNPSTGYHFSVFSYDSNNEMNKLLSINSCQISGYTAPRDPNCTDLKNTQFINQTATSLILDINHLPETAYEHLCVKELYKPGNTNCTAMKYPTMIFANLNPSTGYHFSVFSYDSNNEMNKLLSINSCPISGYTAPRDPNCTDLKNTQFVNQTATSLILDINNLPETAYEHLCVKELYKPGNTNCTAMKYPTMIFANLNPSTGYHFSVFSYDSYNKMNKLLSNNSCQIIGYTGPVVPICGPNLISNKTTNSMVLNLKNVHTPGATSYISEIFHGRNLVKNLTLSNILLQKIANLTAGTSYTLKIYAVSQHNIKSENSCNIENVYMYPDPPKRLTKGDVVKGKTYVVIKWARPSGDVDRYNVTVRCNCSCTPNYTDSVIKTEVNVTQLKPGTHCSIFIKTISLGLLSTPLKYTNIETTETVPGEVSNVTVTDISSTNFTIRWGRPDVLNGDLRNYSVIISNETYNKTEEVLTTNMSFTNLNPGLCFHISIAAVNDAGKGKEKIITVYTNEQSPSEVLDLELKNTSSTSISVTWSKPLYPNGVITQYTILVEKVQGNITSTKQRIYLSCGDCQRPCPIAESFEKSRNADEKKQIDKIEAGVIRHDVKFRKRNQTMHYEITELDIFTEYSITVNALTAAGAGKGENGSITTSEDKPSTPGQPVITDVQIDSVSFSFKKPENENGVITNQEIEYTFIPYNVCSTDEFIKEQTETWMSAIQIDTTNEQFSASLKNLKSYWKYTIRVRVSTYAGFSSYSNETIIQTSPTTPSKVSNIKAAQTFSRRIELTWTQPCHPNGIIISYCVNITNKNDSSTEIRYTNSSITSFNVTSLLPYHLYQFNVYTIVQNVSELSNPTNSTEVLTSTEAPFRPGKINVTFSSNSVNISWGPPEQETGPTRYLVKAIDKVTHRLTNSCQTQGFNNRYCRISGLDSYWTYSLIVQAIVGTFQPNESKTDIQTAESAPGKVSYFTVIQDSNVMEQTNVHIAWRPPIDRDLNGIIKNYYLQYWYQTDQKRIKSYKSRLRETKILVEAEKTYTFQIFAETIENASKADYVSRKLPIKPGAPLPPQKEKFPLINKGPPASDDQTQIAVAFSQAALCNNSNGKIVQWYIIVSKTPGVKVFRGAREGYSEFIQKTYKKWGDVYEKDVNIPYIASDSWNPHCESGSRRKRSAPVETVSYTLGSDGDCESGNRKYCNGNLEPGQTYRVRYAVCTAGGCLESEFSEPFQTAPNHVPAIAGSLTAVVLVLVVIIVVIIILKRRGKGPFKSLDNGEVGQQNEAFNGVEMKGTSKPKAVKIADFANYVQKLHADSNLLFSSEYKLLKETCPTHTTKAAEVQVNRIKNRYTNILSYDHSRVKLLPTEDDEGSDYINANYMPGYSSPREYIATQGPLPFTRDDFWRMIWEQNVSIIVMLTQLVERGRRKCDIYWPEAAREPVYYGDLVVELESESTLPDYVLRVMSIKLGNRVRKVKQLHYLKWPDMGCPETTWLLLNFVGATRLYLPHNDPGPIVVHCSAGVGRTGTFIAVDYLMQHVRTSDVIDIYSYVMKMRNNRPNMVQTEDQYVFIHDCIKDYVNKNDDDTDDEEEEEEKQEDQSIYMNV